MKTIRQIDLPNLRAFAAVSTHRSFRKAAASMGLSPSALIHMVKNLEVDLGVRLLHRSTRSVAPTEAGGRLLDRLENLLLELDGILLEVATLGDRPTGTIRLNAAEPALLPLLANVIPTLMSRFADLSIDIVSDGRLVDVVADGFDAGIRLGALVPQDMIGVRFGAQARFVVVASPDYVAAHGKPRRPEELRFRDCIRTRYPSGRMYRWNFAKGTEAVVVMPQGRIVLDSPALMVEAAAAGVGVAYVLESVAAPLLASGRLTQLLGDWCPPLPGLVLYYAAGRRAPPALLALIEIMREFLPAEN